MTCIIHANIQLLDGHYCHIARTVPMIIGEYKPEGAPEQIKFWLKLEDIKIITEEQRVKNLREISIWINEEDRRKLLDYLTKGGSF